MRGARDNLTYLQRSVRLVRRGFILAPQESHLLLSTTEASSFVPPGSPAPILCMVLPKNLPGPPLLLVGTVFSRGSGTSSGVRVIPNGGGMGPTYLNSLFKQSMLRFSGAKRVPIFRLAQSHKTVGPVKGGQRDELLNGVGGIVLFLLQPVLHF